MSGPRFAVLAVCTANICRSPMMEAMLRDRLDGQYFEVASAGVEGFVGRAMDAMSEMELMRFGLSAPTFRSHPVDEYLVTSADLVLTATAVHRGRVLEDQPRAMRRTFTLLEFAGVCELVTDDLGPTELVAAAAERRKDFHGRADVPDPYRRSPRVHRQAADQISAAVDVVAARLNRALAVASA